MSTWRQLDDIHLGVWDDWESTKSCTDPDCQDVTHSDGHGVASSGGIHNNVVSVQGYQANTERAIVQVDIMLFKLNIILNKKQQ